MWVIFLEYRHVILSGKHRDQLKRSLPVLRTHHISVNPTKVVVMQQVGREAKGHHFQAPSESKLARSGQVAFLCFLSSGGGCCREASAVEVSDWVSN